MADAERVRLDAGQTLVGVFAGRDGVLSLSAIIRLEAPGDRLVAWARNVEALQKGRYVPEIGRFSTPPRLDDLQGLTLEPQDLDDLARCRPGNCGVKLGDAEIAQVRGARDRSALDAAFRRVLVQRAASYLARGDADAMPYHDHKTPVWPAETFAALVQRLEFFPKNLPCYANYVRRYPVPDDGHLHESFLYWSKETLGLKPIVSITHFSVARFATPGMPEVAIVAKQVYATHYKNAAMTVTAVATDGPSRYLIYVNRSHVDAFQGVFGGMVRRVVERRVKAEAPGVLLGLRKRLESGDPPTARPLLAR